jgi:hypothetical protein
MHNRKSNTFCNAKLLLLLGDKTSLALRPLVLRTRISKGTKKDFHRTRNWPKYFHGPACYRLSLRILRILPRVGRPWGCGMPVIVLVTCRIGVKEVVCYQHAV